MTKTANKNEAELLELVSLNTGVETFNETRLIWKKNEKDDYRDVNLSSKNGDLITIREYDSGNHKIFHKPPSGPLEAHRIIRAEKKPEDQEKTGGEVKQKIQETQPVARSRNDGYNPNKSYFAVNVKEDPDMKGLNANAQEAFNQAAFDFKQRTGDSVIVTSGFRGPYRQARTMYDQYFTQGKGSQYIKDLYGPTAEKPNLAAFEVYDQMKGSHSRAAIIDKMADVYQDFADKGIYATGHMRGDKVDISVSNLSSSERSTWEDVMKDHGISSRYHDRHYDITLPKSPSTREHQLAKNSGTETPLQEKAEKAFPGQEVRISGKNIYLNGNVETASGTFLSNGDIWTKDKVIRNKDLSSNDLQISESDMHHIAATMKNGGITQETQVESISAEQAALLANNSGIELKQDQAQPGELGLQSQQLANLSNLENQQGIS